MAGKVGQAFQFNGNNTSEVLVNDSPSLKPTTGLTIDAWINPTTASGDVMHKGCFGSGNCQSFGLLFIPDRQIVFRIGNSTTFDGLGSVSLVPLNS